MEIPYIRCHVYNEVKSLLLTHACQQYIDIVKVLEAECPNYGGKTVPQLEDVSAFLKSLFNNI